MSDEKPIILDLSAIALDFSGDPIFGDDPAMKGKPPATLAFNMNRFVLQPYGRTEHMFHVLQWADSLKKSGKLSLSTADCEVLKVLVEEAAKAGAVIIGPLLLAINKAKAAYETSLAPAAGK